MEIDKTIDSNTVIRVLNTEGGYRGSLLSKVEGVGRWGSSHPDYRSYVTDGPKGKWSNNLEDSIKVVIKSIQKEVDRLSKNSDLQPSQTRRLEFLRDVLTKV